MCMKIYEVKFYCNNYKMLVACDDYRESSGVHCFINGDYPNDYPIFQPSVNDCSVKFIEEVVENNAE